MPRRVNDFRGLAEVSRVLLLGAVQNHPGSRLKELADEAGLHINTACDHLRVLVDEGFVYLQSESTGSGDGRRWSTIRSTIRSRTRPQPNASLALASTTKCSAASRLS